MIIRPSTVEQAAKRAVSSIGLHYQRDGVDVLPEPTSVGYRLTPGRVVVVGESKEDKRSTKLAVGTLVDVQAAESIRFEKMGINSSIYLQVVTESLGNHLAYPFPMIIVPGYEGTPAARVFICKDTTKAELLEEVRLLVITHKH